MFIEKLKVAVGFVAACALLIAGGGFALATIGDQNSSSGEASPIVEHQVPSPREISASSKSVDPARSEKPALNVPNLAPLPALDPAPKMEDAAIDPVVREAFEKLGFQYGGFERKSSDPKVPQADGMFAIRPTGTYIPGFRWPVGKPFPDKNFPLLPKKSPNSNSSKNSTCIDRV